jgi:hypothetical protein
MTSEKRHLPAFVFVPSVFGENIPIAEFEIISAETACWDIENSQIFNENFYLPLYLPLWCQPMGRKDCTM